MVDGHEEINEWAHMWKIKAPIFQQNNIKLYVIFYGDDDEYIYIF